MALRSRESVGRAGTRTPVKERLLSVATRLFARHGFESTSVQDIVDAVIYISEARQVTGEVLHVDGGAHVGKW